MNNKLQNVCDNFIATMGDLSASFGLNRVMGQMYALLFISKEPLSLDSIGDRLKVSKGTVSTNIRTLENWGAVKKAWVKNSRKDFYQANLDTLAIVMERLQVIFQKRLNGMSATINEMERILQANSFEGEEKKTAALYRERIQKVKKMTSTIDKTLKNIPKIKYFQALLNGL